MILWSVVVVWFSLVFFAHLGLGYSSAASWALPEAQSRWQGQLSTTEQGGRALLSEVLVLLPQCPTAGPGDTCQQWGHGDCRWPTHRIAVITAYSLLVELCLSVHLWISSVNSAWPLLPGLLCCVAEEQRCHFHCIDLLLIWLSVVLSYFSGSKV